MTVSYFRLVFFFVATVGPVMGATYAQTDSHQGSGFLKSFSVQSIADPTNGRVSVNPDKHRNTNKLSSQFLFRNYVDGPTAASLNLTFSSGDHFVLRADSTTVLDPSGPGRNSVRIMSNDQYTTSVMVFVSFSCSPTSIHNL